MVNTGTLNNHNQPSSPLPEPIGKGRSNSSSSSITSNDGHYQRAPGSEREDFNQVSKKSGLDINIDIVFLSICRQCCQFWFSRTTSIDSCFFQSKLPAVTSLLNCKLLYDFQFKLRQQLQAIDNDASLDAAEKAKRKQNLMLVHNLSYTTNGSLSGTSSSAVAIPTGMSPFAPAFYPPRDTVGSVIGNCLIQNGFARQMFSETSLKHQKKQFSVHVEDSMVSVTE